ncbi:MAG: hypothetical protein NUV80_00920 [Candidatus Berkelbacteria bacterium]|nr:hypothetical protein [Candidatus Berkelbacteria bacterium]
MKSIFTSKTFLLALLQAVAGVVVVFATAYPQVGELMVAKSVIDVVLRAFTSEAVSTPLGSFGRKA